MHAKVVQTSSKSCSAGAGGVLGREGATDSAARRPIVESEGGKAREREVFRSVFSGRKSHAFRERNLEHRLHSELEIQAIN